MYSGRRLIAVDDSVCSATEYDVTIKTWAQLWFTYVRSRLFRINYVQVIGCITLMRECSSVTWLEPEVTVSRDKCLR